MKYLSNVKKLFSNKMILIIVAFIVGLIFCSTYKTADLYENFDAGSRCHNVLIRKNNELHLLNTKKAKIPGVNPIVFKNLEEYAEFAQWQQKMNIKCPILYLQETYNTQNVKGLRLLNDPLTPQSGFPSNPPPLDRTAPTQLLKDSNREDPPYNQNQFAGFDPEDQYIGVETPLDRINSIALQDASAMETAWKGMRESNRIVDSGAFKDRTRQPKK